MMRLATALGAWPVFVAVSVFPVCAVSADEGYITDDNVLIKSSDGAQISAFVVRPRDDSHKLPAALQFTIYADRSALKRAQQAASRGYVGVIGFTRGKWTSPNSVVPYEYDGEDARAVIDWISRQPWSDGRVGMYGGSYDKLDIPILAIDGYYDDGQNNAIRRLQEHYRHRPKAEHYFLIGPYDHFGTQGSTKPEVLRGYSIDPVAQLDTVDLTFDWFDYVLKGAKKPQLLQDKINYQVMGANVWRHAPSIETMSETTLTLYLDSQRDGDFYRLARSKPVTRTSLKSVVDYADRNAVSANDYPGEIVTGDLGLAQGLAFVSEPFARPVSVNGLFSATLKATINKKDLDLAVVLYEVMPDGKYFHLSYTVQRASYAADMTRRQLSKGSRLLVVVDVSRGPFAQVNHGTGKDVSDESVADAKEPLRVEWFNDSHVDIPLSQ